MVKKRRYITDYIDIDFFRSDILGFKYKYSFDGSNENYYISFHKNNKSNIDIEYDLAKPPHYYWLSFFDYNKYPEEIDFKSKLEAFYFDCINRLLSLDDHQDLEQVVITYREYVAYHPYFLSYFENIYKIIHNLIKGNKNLDIYLILEEIKKDLTTIGDTYVLMKDFIYWSLIFSNDSHKIISPKTVANLHSSYLYEVGANNIFLKYINKNSIGFLPSDIFSNEATYILNGIEGYINNKNNIIEIDGDISYDHEFADTLNYLIDNEYILSKCPNCERYFIKKYTSPTTYCSNLFRNTKANCQEYSSRAKYQNRLYANPIQAEYYRIRKRKTMQIKRGKLSENEARLDDLKKLRDKYLKLFNNSLQEDKNKIISDFKEAIITLYGEK